MASTVSGVLLTGNHASRPTTGVTAGTLYACSTHSLIYQTSDTGSTWTTWATLGTGTSTTTIANDTIWAAKGDIVAATANDAAAVLTAGANDTILMADSAASNGLKWVASATPSTQAFGDAAAVGTSDTFTRGDHKHAMPASPGILAVHRYAPASQTVLSVTSATLTDVDATNMVVTFTAPASGNVLVTLSAYADISAGTGDGWWGLRESSTDLGQIRVIRNQGNAILTTAVWYLTGVSAGSHTYKWAFRSASGAGDTTRIILQDGANGTWGPGIMVVESAP